MSTQWLRVILIASLFVVTLCSSASAADPDASRETDRTTAYAYQDGDVILIGNFDIDNLDTPTFRYLLDLAELGAGQLIDFLYAGKMLKDPPIEARRVSVPFRSIDDTQYWVHNTTRVLYSTWKTHNGRAALILTNWQDQENAAQLTVSPEDLEVPPGTPLLLLDATGLNVLETSWDAEKSISLNLPPRSTIAIVADPGHIIIPPPRKIADGR
ncbi:MAG: hypothetical protein GY906_15000 [bacterium]|nr:hypothetical protein [bacterium]